MQKEKKKRKKWCDTEEAVRLKDIQKKGIINKRPTNFSTNIN